MTDQQKAITLAAQLRAVPTLYPENGYCDLTAMQKAASSILMEAFECGLFDSPADAWLAGALRIQVLYRNDPKHARSWEICTFHECVKHFAPDLHRPLTRDRIDAACRLIADSIDGRVGHGGSIERGPIPPNGFHWPGCCDVTMTPIPWRLLNHVWNAEGKACQTEEAVEDVWKCDASDSAVKSAISRVNNLLLDKEVPVSLSQKNGYITVTIDE